ncbi:MAG: HD domain-containing protein [Planctomycetes bacterium]|jgi:HD superfamily phosphohydrolase|nr:HD domain-containing protein [Planctomycetota bacterium]
MAARKAHLLAASVPELAPAFVRLPPVRLPELRNVALTRRVLSLVDHPDFQRLRLIRQLGPTHLVYPGAVHTRFEHSLGVYDAVRKYLNTLLQDPAFTEAVGEEDVLALLAAALLHDVGHYPLAHNLEALSRKGEETPRHEDMAVRILRGELTLDPGGRPLGGILRAEWGLDPERVGALIGKSWEEHRDATDRILASILSSPIDADKMDYLERDSIHMGVPYGRNGDRERFLSSLLLSPEGDRIAVSDKGRVSAEIFVFGRYTMFSEAYWHHTVRAASAMAERGLSDWRARTGIPMDELVGLLFRSSDDSLLARVHETAPEGSRARRLVEGLLGGRRRLYKRAVTLSLVHLDPRRRAAFELIYRMGSAEVTRLEDRIRARLAAEGGVALRDGDVIVDTPPVGKDKLGVIPVVLGKGDSRRAVPLDQLSMIVRGIAEDFAKVVKKIRVFLDPGALPELRARLGAPAIENAILEEVLRAPDALPF